MLSREAVADLSDAREIRVRCSARLTIRAERTARSEEGVKWLAHERPSGSFLRQLNLGDGIDTEGISAHYENGVLSVMIPISEKAKPRKVEVMSATRESQKQVNA